jgi:predicted RNA-binding protein YlxR (DUF448 family)
MRRRHIPLRTCIVCRQSKDKRELVRLVRTSEGELVVDETGKKNGRGAYLCRQRTCWEKALQGNQVSRSLKMEVGENERQMLADWMERLEG